MPKKKGIVLADTNHPVPEKYLEDVKLFVEKVKTLPRFYMENEEFLGGNVWWVVFKRISYTMTMGMKFYLSVHMLPVIFKPKALLKRPVPILSRVLWNALRSSLFITAYCCGSIGGAIMTRTVRKQDDSWLGVVGGLVSGLSILIEKASRRSELVVYMIPRVLESAYKTLLNAGRAPNIRHGEVLLFMVAWAILGWQYQRQPSAIRPLDRSVLKRLLGRN